jgi:arginosuccinate synthase-like protein
VTGRVRRAVLAYSGGLDTSIIIPRLKETYGCELIALAAGVPLTRLSLDALREITPLFDPDVFQWLDARAAVERRACEGGTAPECVAVALRRVRDWSNGRPSQARPRTVDSDARR